MKPASRERPVPRGGAIRRPGRPAPRPLRIHIAILAGGQSSRMGRDKARLNLHRQTLLAHVRARARETGAPHRVIRRDIVPRCGPLGGIYTALKSSRADAELFLACDMPFVTARLLSRITERLRPGDAACFATADGVVGFPFVVRPAAAPIVLTQIQRESFSLQDLAKALAARRIAVQRPEHAALFNINTPQDLSAAVRAKRPRRQHTNANPPAVPRRRIPARRNSGRKQTPAGRLIAEDAGR